MNIGKIVLVIASEGYQHIEYGVTKKVLEGMGFDVVTASNRAGTAVADDGSAASVDIVLADAIVPKYAGIFFIGGPGTLEHLDNKVSYDVIRKAMERNIPLGAICIATRILAQAGALNGRQATGWDGDDKLENIYRTNNVHYMHQNVVVDDHVVTAIGPDAAQEFAEQIVLLLQGDKSWG